LAVTDIINQEKSQPLDMKNIRQLMDKGKSIIKGDAKSVLNGILNDAGDDFNKFISGLEIFYDDAMDRASGWFKKNHRKILMIIVFVITIALNVDTIQITNTLWKDRESLKRASELAIENMKGTDITNSRVLSVGKNDSTTWAQKLVSGYGDIKTIDVTIKEMPIPIGWGKANYPDTEKSKNIAWDWLTKILGWCITSIALFLGAPFWFDMLNKIVNLRATGIKPTKISESDENSN
jgi:hypothetical protein